MSEQKNDVIPFQEPIQIEEIEKAFQKCDIQCVDKRVVARRVAEHISKAVRAREKITRQKFHSFFMRCI